MTKNSKYFHFDRENTDTEWKITTTRIGTARENLIKYLKTIKLFKFIGSKHVSINNAGEEH